MEYVAREADGRNTDGERGGGSGYGGSATRSRSRSPYRCGNTTVTFCAQMARYSIGATLCLLHLDIMPQFSRMQGVLSL